MTAYRDCWRLAWPLILANLSVPLLGLVDTAVVGHLPEPHFLAATALGALVMSVLYFLFGFLRMGTTALVAQAFGAHDAVEQRAVPIRALMVAGVLGLVLIAASPLVLRACDLVFAPAPAVAEGLHTYLLIRVFGAPAALGSFVVLGWFLGVLDSRRPLLLLVLTNAINAILAVAFVWGLGLGVAGAAISTLVAETAGFAAGVALVLHRWRGLPWPSRRSVLQRSRFVRLLVVNRDLFLRSLMLESVFVAFSALGSRQGEVVLAANAILMNFFTFSAYGLDGFAHAAEAMIGRAVGARDVRGFRAAARAGFGLAALLAVPMTLAFWLAGPAMVRLMTDIPSVLDTALRYLPFAAILPAVSIWAFVFDGIFFGATRTAELRNAMLATLLVFAALAAILPGAYGNSGLWTAFLVFLAARAVFLGLIYWRADGGAAFARG
jgi:MATE family multidrug resistance protein